MEGDTGNHKEEGIFKAQRTGIERRLNQRDGLREQHSWSVGYLGSRVLGFFFIFYYVSMFAVLASYSFFGSILVVVVYLLLPIVVLAILRYRSWRRVQKVREDQYSSYK